MTTRKHLREAFEKEHPKPTSVVFDEALNRYVSKWGGSLSVLRVYEARWNKWKRDGIVEGWATSQPIENTQESGPVEMNAERAAFYMRRFKAEEKMLGPQEQAAIDYVLAMLANHTESSSPTLESIVIPVLSEQEYEQYSFEERFPPPPGVSLHEILRRYCVGAKGSFVDMLVYQAAWVAWRENLENPDEPLVCWL